MGGGRIVNVTLTPQQQAAIDAAGKRFNVDPRLITAVYGKESSFGTNPVGIADVNPFWAFGLKSGPGAYDYSGYNAKTNTFDEAANTVASFYADERNAYDRQHGAGVSFLQYADNIYSPPSDGNADSLRNLVSIYKGLGGDPNGEATYSGNVWDPTDPNNLYDPRNWHKIVDPKQITDATTGPIAGAIANLQSAANDWVLYASAGALFLALIGGGFAIMAAGNSTVRKAAEGALA
jgi:hypothetical protein